MRILVVSPSWIGDTVISNSMYQLLIMRYKDAVSIDVLVSQWCYDIVTHMIEIDNILLSPYIHGTLELIKYFRFGKILRRKKKYHQAIVLPNSFKSALVPFFAGIVLRTGWRGEMRYGVLNDLRKFDMASSFPLLVQRYAALAYDCKYVTHFSHLPSPLPMPRLNVQKEEIKKVLFKLSLDMYTRPMIGLCVSAEFGPSKIWPHYHYMELAIRLVYWGYHVVLLGSVNRRRLVLYSCLYSDICQNAQQHYTNLINRTSLNEAMAVIACCRVIVSNDSGLLHVACALQRSVIALYGPTDPGFTPPLSDSAIVLRCVHDDNNRCFKTRKNIDDPYGYHDSLINITPDQVLQALQLLLDRKCTDI